MNKWTDAQLEAIFTSKRKDGSGCNILVSAAAGSGKTAVLVRRIIEKLIPENVSEGIEPDRLLVVTFTNAAAREMESRISAALSEAYETASDNGDYERKKAIKHKQMLLPSSDITTIDAFCLKLVREYFSVLEIDPSFSIADDAQASILAEETLEELFAELYDSGDKDFSELLLRYGTTRSDEPLADLIRHIYGFIVSQPEPFKWLNEKTEELLCKDGIENTAWFKRGTEECRGNLTYAHRCTADALKIMCGESFGDEFYRLNPPEKGVEIYDEWKSYYKLFHTLNALLSEKNPELLYKNVVSFTFPRFYALPSKSDEEKAPLVMLRDGIKAAVSSAKSFLSVSAKEAEDMSKSELYPVAAALMRITEKYHKKLFEKKKERGIFEFYDIEQLTEKLLRTDNSVAEELRARYDEILMDEYQDTSPLQERIFTGISNGENLFTVGDMKQSIYRFRSSDPSIFKSKNDTYLNITDAENRKIVLSRNFRSRAEVLSGVNDLFRAIMSEEAGELDYDDEQMLYCGNRDFVQSGQNFMPECCVLELPEKTDENDISAAEYEASFIAREINRLKAENFQITDKNGTRPIENRDIVILMSSYKASADIYTSVFNNAGIECFAESESYFERSEIKLILALLKIILNPTNDIPLIGIMRSPIGSFTDDELAHIRSFSAGSFYSAVCEFAHSENSNMCETAKKARDFIEKLTHWRYCSRYMPSDRLIWTLYEETDFYAFTGALHGGEEAQANLRLLFERAKEFENSGFQGLFSFIKYLERMKKSEKDLSSAKLIGEGHNVVRLMTIHKSKGLEFPVVFLAGGSKRFRRGADNPHIILHKNLGIALDRIDVNEDIRYETPAKSVFKSVIYAEQTSEEIRKLYVAATRAKEKFYFVASVSSDDNLKNYVSEKKSVISGDKIAPKAVLSSSNFADWVVPVSLSSKNWIFRTVKCDKLRIPHIDTALSIDTDTDGCDTVKIMDYSYPHADASDLPTKVSVSKLKSETGTPIVPYPNFLNTARRDGAYFGTVLHTAMQNIIPITDMNTEYVKSELKRLVNENIFTADEAELVDIRKILDFYVSELGKRIISAKNVLREQPFEISVPASFLFDGAPDDENILLQGVIDCLIEEDDGIVILDYKTDYYSDISEIREKYERQLELYAYAADKILKKPIKDKIIYLFFDNSVLYL